MPLDVVEKGLTAVAPVIILLLVLDRLDIFNLITLRTIGLLVCVGGGVAALSYLANWSFLEGFPIARTAHSRYVAPAIEESLKALPVIYLFATNRVGFKLDSAIAGFAVGAGFSVVENAWYLYLLANSDYAGWLVRGFGTAIMHGGATALFAAASHEMTERQAEGNAAHYRFNALLFLPGLAAAYALHSAFNHFTDHPALAMALTLVLAPLSLFIVFARSERPTHIWIRTDYAVHQLMLEEIRGGHFAETETGKALKAIAGRFHGAAADEVFAYFELKLTLVLRAEEIMLAIQDGKEAELSPQDRDMVDQLGQVERRLGAGVLTAIAPRLGFSRNDLWELERFKAKARRA
ncbi:MAG TPA: PrsW family glutamic-type intramembrane protease [Caulobacterales bacterium]|nr:PrsW family glutamic-type intramembrane protease [Caulobacterales bacterium]